MTAPFLMLAVGNEARGDDALGPLLLRRVQAWLATQGEPERFELLEDFQLQVEHATDLCERDLVLFIDAGLDTPPPFHFYRADADGAGNLFSHALRPEAVLAVYAQVFKHPPPPTFVLCIRGERFELGSSLSTAAGGNLVEAVRFVEARLRQPELSQWQAYIANQKKGAHAGPLVRT